MSETTSMVFNGQNGSVIRRWVDAQHVVPPSETWFLTKGMTGSTQVWRYLREDRVWSEDVKAALYDRTTDRWTPIRIGDAIEMIEIGHDRYFNVVRS